MREIEFRGKSKNSGRWVYGDLVINKYQSRQGIHIYEKSNSINCKSGYQFVRVDKNTLGQYTCLKDKNGTKIFEGDVVNMLNITDYPMQIKWSKKWARFIFYNLVNKTEMNLFTEQCEVIGNIYDNTELVNGE